MTEQVLLTIAHNLFLSKEERHRLQEPGVEVVTVGITLPVWVRGAVTSEPAEEILACYRLRTHTTPGVEPIHITSDGFILSFAETSFWSPLRDVKDGGSECIYLTYHGKVSMADRELMVINYINVQDISVLQGKE